MEGRAPARPLGAGVAGASPSTDLARDRLILRPALVMKTAIEFRLNGKEVRVENVSPNLTLLDWLRSRGLTGSKEGCAEGDCGACSVAIIDRDRKGKPAYRAINSCLVPLPLMAGRDVITVEGVAGDQLHPVQQAMVENHGSQCGYCTPGFIMSLFEGYYRTDLKTSGQLDEQLCGNLCRCTGYRAIRDAAADAFEKRNGADQFDAAADNGVPTSWTCALCER